MSSPFTAPDIGTTWCSGLKICTKELFFCPFHTDDIKTIFPHYFHQETDHNSSVRFHTLLLMRCDTFCSAAGRNTENTEPFPFAELTFIYPPSAEIISRAR